MSTKKVIDTSSKVLEDENTDSGFLSGPISEQLTSSEDCDSKECDSEPAQLDSGLDLCLSECLSNINLSESDVRTPTQAPPIAAQGSEELEPLTQLFLQDDDGDTQLHIAAVHGCERSVGTLVRACPERAWYDVPNDFGHTALHLAAASAHAVVARMLVRAGASVGVRDLRGRTPLHVAAAAGHAECLQALLAPVAPVAGRPHRKLAAVLNQKDYNGQTCVHLAVRSGHIDALHILVYYGADINARDGLCGWTALHVAAARGDAGTARYLLERGPGAAGAADYAGRSPRRLAARTPAAAVFAALAAAPDSSDDSDDDDEMLYDSDQSLFERLRDGLNAINVA